ncbi:MAG: HIT domain-containing protein [Coriobacteriia bacterium]
MKDCIFCEVAKGQTSAKVVYEDESVIAFEDIQPQAPIHTLIIPKEHYGNLSDNVPHDVLCALMEAIPVVAEIKGVAESGYRVIVNNGPDAMQVVKHLHIHILGGQQMSHRMVSASQA